MHDALNLEDIIHFLLDAPMFGDLDATGLSRIVHIMEVRTLPRGSYVFREGDPGDAWYVVYEGEVEVLKSVDGDQRQVALLERRACFGEMAILDGSPRSASVRARTDITTFRFPRVAFNQLLASDNLSAYKLVYQMARVLVARQRSTTARLANLLDQVPATEAISEQLQPIVDRSAVAE